MAQNLELAAEFARPSGIWVGSGVGFASIGSPATPFAGSFNGLNHTISGITINQPSLSYVGLFGVAGAASTISNVGTLNGMLGAGGNVSITQASRSVALGNLSAGGALDFTAVSGDITQAAGTSIVSAGTSRLAAPNSNVTLAASGNSLGTVIVSGAMLRKSKTP